MINLNVNTPTYYKKKKKKIGLKELLMKYLKYVFFCLRDNFKNKEPLQGGR